MKKLFLLCFAIAFTLNVFAQISLSGVIRDSQTNEALSGAHLSLQPTFLTQISNERGEFGFTNLKPGVYTLKVTYLGYDNVVQVIEVKSDEFVDIGMFRRPIMEEEVVVLASRVAGNSPVTFTNIEKEQIQKSNFGNDIPFLLATTPSLVATSDAGAGIGYTGLKIRGTDITRINVTLNGVQWNDPESHSVYWVNLPDLASSIESIQIQRGVGTSSNGAAAFGGSINIQTQSLRADPYAEISSIMGSFNTFKNAISVGTGLIDGKFTLDGRFSKINSDGYVDRATSNLESVYFLAGYFTDKTLVKFNMISGREKTYQAWNGAPYDSLFTNRTFNPSGLYYNGDGSIGYYDNETDNYKQDHYQFTCSRTLNRKMIMNLTAFMVKGFGYFENMKQNQKFSNYGLSDFIIGNDTIKRTDLVRRKYLDNAFYGGNFSFKYQHSQTLQSIIGGGYNYYDGNHYGKIVRADFGENIPEDFLWYQNNGIKKQYNLFGKVNYEHNQRFNLFAEMQLRAINYSINGIHDNLLDISQKHDYLFVNPKAGFVVPVNKRNQVYFSAAIANREPTRTDLKDADLDNQPKEELLLNIEAGHTYTSNDFRFHTNLFFMDYKDQLVMTGKINRVGDPVFTNVPNSYRAGVELAFGWKPTSNLNWQANLTLSKNKILNFTEYVDNWSPPFLQIETDLGTTDISFSPSVTGSSILSYRILEGFDVALISKYVGKQYIDNTSNDDRKLDPYFVNDLMFRYSISTGFIKGIDLSFTVNNIFDRKYITHAWIYRYFEDGGEYHQDGYFPQAGINILGGVFLKF